MQMPPVTLAIDFGTKRVGLAISRGTLAEPLYTISHDSQVIEKLKQVIAEENVAQVVMGLSENEMAIQTQHFAQKLQQELEIPLEFIDETLSSHTVEQKMKESGMKKSRRQGAIDHYAAAEFLQDWLDLNT